jgi:hypothetical protein
MQSVVSLAREILIMLLCMIGQSIMYPRSRFVIGLSKLLAQSLGLILQWSLCDKVEHSCDMFATT